MQSATIRLLEQWKTVKGIASDHAAWQELNLSNQSAISNWRHGRSHAAPHLVERMARDIGQDAGKWLALVQADRSSGPDAKTWANLARKLGAMAGFALCAVIVSGIAAPTTTYAQSFAALHLTYCLEVPTGVSASASDVSQRRPR